MDRIGNEYISSTRIKWSGLETKSGDGRLRCFGRLQRGDSGFIGQKMLKKSKNTKRVYGYNEERHAVGVCDRGGCYT